MPRRGENIYKRKDGRWEGRYIKERDDFGKAKYGYVYASSYRAVREKLKMHSENALASISNPKDGIYSDILTSWLKNKQLSVKESTYMKYKYMVSSYIIPNLGGLNVETIDGTFLGRFSNELLHSGRKNGNGGLSPKTVTSILSVIKESLIYASHNGHSTHNDRIIIKKKEKEMRALSIDEQTKLTDFLRTNTDLYKLGVLISLYTGIRVGELCALRWEHINFDQKVIHVCETLQRIQTDGENSKTRIIITEPKSSCSIRDIPIPNCLLPIIKQFASAPKAYLLTGDSSTCAEPRTMQYHFAKYIKKVGIAPANYHALRHTFATRCVEAGFEIKSLSEILGHANVNITLNKYVHSSFELKAVNMNKLKF